MREALRCHVCSSDRLVDEPFGYHFNGRWLGAVQCKDCGIIFLHPQPTAEELKRLYSVGYFEQDYRCGHEQSYFDEGTLSALVDETLLDRIQQHKPRGRFLEIGCAGGAFLNAARERGYTVTGVEFSEEAAAFARERFDLPVAAGDLLGARLEDASIDLVFMGDVIEHLPEPVRTLHEVYRVMAPGGVLVLACPSQTNTLFTRCGMLAYRLLGMKATVHLPPYHLFEYRPRSITSLLLRCRFETLHIGQSMIAPGKVGLRGSLLQRIGKITFQAPNYLLTRIFGVLGDRLEIYAVKPL
jgi:SAM-dependent methyltransferase